MLIIIKCESCDMFDFILRPIAKRDDVLITDISHWQQVEKDVDKANILFLGYSDLKQQHDIAKAIGCQRAKSFVWQGLNEHFCTDKHLRAYDEALSHYGIEIFTLDINDSAEYGFTLVDAVYYNHKKEKEYKIVNEILFVGDQAKLKANHTIDLFDSQRIKLKCVDNHSYEAVVDNIRHCHCLLEILDDGATAWTPRTLEALFYEKKLITNNRGLLEAPFYNSNNIFIIGVDDCLRLVSEFMEEPYITIDDDVKQKYNVETWIEQFR